MFLLSQFGVRCVFYLSAIAHGGNPFFCLGHLFGFFFCAPALEHAQKQHARDHDQDHDRRQGIDVRGDAGAVDREDQHRERGLPGTCEHVGHDDVVDGQGKAQKRRREDAGHDARDRHAPEGLHPVCPEIHGRLLQGVVVAADAPLDRDDGVGDAEGTVSNDNRAHAEFDAERHEDDKHGDRQYDLRHDNRHIEHEVYKFFSVKLELFKSYAAEHADHHADDRGDDGDDQRVDQRLPQVVVSEGEELSVPHGGKALPGVITLGVVERKLDHYQHRDIEQRVNDRRIDAAEYAAASLTF